MSKITEKKLKTLKYFTKQLLTSKIKKEISKMILFGSLAEGKARKQSDIDVLIFTRKKPLKKVEDIIDESSFDATVQYGESVEPLIYSLQEYNHPKSAFLIKTIKSGKEIFSTI